MYVSPETKFCYTLVIFIEKGKRKLLKVNASICTYIQTNPKTACKENNVYTRILLLSLNSVSGKSDRLCSLVVRILGYTMEIYCDSCEVRTEFIYVL
jgi:hypothetical protein